jgi:tetratricopeptide (TPR) repeat protein
MSIEPMTCRSCRVAGSFAGASALSLGSKGETAYGIAWRCGTCQAATLDVCPIGPVEPTERCCLNCGSDLSGHSPCSGCGLTHTEAAGFLRVADGALGVDEAKAAFQLGLFRRGFATLNALLQRNAALSDAWVEKAKAYRHLRLNEAAVRCYRRALALQYDPLLEISMACALADLGKHAEALEVYDEVIARSPDAEWSAIAHANRGNAHEALDGVDAAASDYEEAIRRDPGRVTHYLNYARLFARRGRWAEAHDVVSRGLLAVATTARLPLLLEKARTANEQARADVGLSAADEALSLAPNDRHALYQRGWALGMLGRLREAQTSMRRILELEPNDPDAQRGLGMIESALRGRQG